MFKKTMTTKGFDDVERTKIYYFNYSEAELAQMALSYEGGMDNKIQAIIDAKDQTVLIPLFKEIILGAYGEKSDDGMSFIKRRDGHALSEDFEQTQAFSDLYMELITDDKAAAAFIKALVPNFKPVVAPAT